MEPQAVQAVNVIALPLGPAPSQVVASRWLRHVRARLRRPVHDYLHQFECVEPGLVASRWQGFFF